jgi:hypothetical protein
VNRRREIATFGGGVFYVGEVGGIDATFRRSSSVARMPSRTLGYRGRQSPGVVDTACAHRDAGAVPDAAAGDVADGRNDQLSVEWRPGEVW